ncbi:MAG TPA: hypothetical protein VE076_12250 [Nitrososphaeraceae archaeon]|nr:hypothetical protein [Nitrososphaeraceae archaeon]
MIIFAKEKIDVDKVLIVGTYYAPQTTATSSANTNAVILLHMLGHNRNDWNDFASTILR